MQLDHIFTTACPKCGCRIIASEEVDTREISFPVKTFEVREHTHGGKWETRRFACGYITEYSPNGRQEEEAKFSRCKHDPELERRREYRKNFKLEVEKVIREMPVETEEDKNFIAECVVAIQGIRNDG